jgi:hypothetical protein
MKESATMPSWQEIQQYARTKYRLQNDNEHSFSLVFGYEDGRSQIITVRHITGFGKEWCEFRSPVCHESQMPPKVALRKNSDEFVLGALSLDSDGDYIFVYSACLENMDLEEFELPLHAIAVTADKLETAYSGEDKF